MGEAVKNIPDTVKDTYPAVNWKAVTGMRDKLIHEYFGVSFFIVWETIKHDLPTFKTGIKILLKIQGREREVIYKDRKWTRRDWTRS